MALSTSHQSPLDSGIYKVAEVAEILRCDTSTVYRLIESERLEVVRLGRSFRVTRAAIIKFLGA